MQLILSSYLAGLVWFVHVVHYPLFDGVGEDHFHSYHQRHVRDTGFVVAIPMLLELALAITAVIVQSRTPKWCSISGAVLVVIVWISTFGLQVPEHNRLSNGFDDNSYRRLVSTNVVRTIAWSCRVVLTAFVVYTIANK